MADSTNHFTSAIEAMFQGVDQLVTTKTVVGDAVRVDDAIILPLIDVTCGRLQALSMKMPKSGQAEV